MADDTDLIGGVAQYLDGLGLVTYDPTGTTGDCFVDGMPPTPDVAVALGIYDGGDEPDSKLPYDEPRLQVKVRGGPDPRTSRSLCAQIRDALHGLGPLTLPDGTELILAVALQGAPAGLGQDENRRHEHVVNYRMEIVNPTTHRA